jgi:hypothetical protein
MKQLTSMKELWVCSAGWSTNNLRTWAPLSQNNNFLWSRALMICLRMAPRLTFLWETRVQKDKTLLLPLTSWKQNTNNFSSPIAMTTPRLMMERICSNQQTLICASHCSARHISTWARPTCVLTIILLLKEHAMMDWLWQIWSLSFTSERLRPFLLDGIVHSISYLKLKDALLLP